MKNLVIVESPTKARTLSQFLGKNYRITASMGHVRDLPRGEFGVDVEKEFAPKYVIPKEKIKSINNLAKEAAGVDQLWLATDPDREGEAIAWHLLQIINQKLPSSATSDAKAMEVKKASEGKKIPPKARFDARRARLAKGGKIPQYSRVVFHEITKDAVLEAFENPRKIDDDLVEAQQARRVLDRIVGYKLSPVLWKKVKSRLSAGRVQSVALRLVVDREREIEAFKSEEYWEIFVEVTKVSKGTEGPKAFTVKLVQINEKKAEVKNKEEADKIVNDLENSTYGVLEIRQKDVFKSPQAPFTTSTLQQAASSKLGFSPKKTMRIAQDLYEHGLITYMRTDSVNLSPQAIGASRKFIESEFGKDYLPQSARVYKVKSRLAQEAHEAIRPTNIQLTHLRPLDFAQGSSGQATSDHQKLYDLIWKRMVACQMKDAQVSETQVDVEAKVANSVYLLRASGQKIKFDGWYKAYTKPPIQEQVLPHLEAGQPLDLVEVKPEQKFTEPPPRFTEATLIRELEKNGIGRPSTYAPTISTLYDRVYIERLEGRKIGPTPIGKTAVDFLVKHFGKILDLSFTATLEDDLDQIAQGKEDYLPTIKKFWEPFEKDVERVMAEVEKVKMEVEETDEKCDKCGKPMVVRYGRFGKFLACSGFPDCKNTKALSPATGLICQQCGGNIVTKRTKRGRIFWGCENWPKCKFASWTKPATAEVAESV